VGKKKKMLGKQRRKHNWLLLLSDEFGCTTAAKNLDLFATKMIATTTNNNKQQQTTTTRTKT